MVVQADEKSTDRGFRGLIPIPKRRLLTIDVPPPYTPELGEFYRTYITKPIQNGLSNVDTKLSNLGVDIEGYTRNNTKTLNNSIKNVSNDVSTMSRSVTQEVSAVSKGISGLSGMVTGVSSAVTSIANGALMSLLLENIVKPMFDTTNKTIDLGRVTMQKFFEKQIAIFTPVSTFTNSHSNDSGFIQLLKNMSNGIKTSLDNFATSFQNMFRVGGYGASINRNDSTLVRLWKELTQATLNRFDQLMSMFHVASYSSSIFQSDSDFVKMLKNLFQSIKIPSLSTIENSLIDIIKNISKVPALNDLIKNGFTDLAKTFTSILEPIKNIGINVVKALFDAITKFFVPSDPNFLKNKIKGIQTKFNTKFQTPLSFLNLFKTLFSFKRTPFPKQVTLIFYGKETVIPLLILTMLFDVVRPITTALLCLMILAECYKRISGSDEATLQ